MRGPLLIEIGCEEIPARMIRPAAAELAQRLVRLLDQAALGHGVAVGRGGPRRLAVSVADVEGLEADREEQVLGPPEGAAFDGRGQPTRAAEGFARKQGIDPAALVRVRTERGVYVGFSRRVVGRSLERVLAEGLGPSVEGMPFPKTMRWGDGQSRWVRPVHWLVALHGDRPLELQLFGVRSGTRSMGHRFLSSGVIEIPHAERYAALLEEARVLVDHERRREELSRRLEQAAVGLGARLVDDPALLEEVADLVEWPGVVVGRFDPVYLDLPRDLLVTTLRHHQKCFSLETPAGRLAPAFLAVANTDRDPGGHVRRGNEWVVGGRLEDARYFWREDRKRGLDQLRSKLARVTFHAKAGTYADKTERLLAIALRLSERVAGQGDPVWARAAALSCKLDLVSGTVGEFPELQGRIGGLLLQEQGLPEPVWRAVYHHYQPQGPDDPIPPTAEGAILSLADKLDSVAELVRAGETPTGSRDPYALRRATNGIFRIVLERGWALAIEELWRLCGEDPALLDFLVERLQSFLKERGSTPHELNAVLRPRVSPHNPLTWALPDVVARLDALGTVRERADFAHLVDLTKRVDNILTKNQTTFDAAIEQVGGWAGYEERQAAALALWELLANSLERLQGLEREGRYGEVIDLLARFVEPVERFFAEVLVIDPAEPRAMLHRREQLAGLNGVLTRCFDIRELAGQAERRGK